MKRQNLQEQVDQLRDRLEEVEHERREFGEFVSMAVRSAVRVLVPAVVFGASVAFFLSVFGKAFA